MNALEKYYLFLDNSGYDCHNEADINEELKKVIDSLIKIGKEDIANYAEVDRQAILIRKRFDLTEDEKGRYHPEGLKWMLSGKRTIEDGTEEDFVWPDYKNFSDKSFAYIWERYENTKNIYLKTEYGLVGYFSGNPTQARRKDFKLKLCDELSILADRYLQKSLLQVKNNYYILDYIRTIKGVIYIAENEKDLLKFDKVANQLFQIHKNWDLTHLSSLRVILDIPAILLQYPKSKSIIDFEKILEKNVQAALAWSENDPQKAIYVADASLLIEQRTKVSAQFDWVRLKAEQYERLAEDAKMNSVFRSLSMYEQALSLYNQINDFANAEKILEEYKLLRGSQKLGQTITQIPDEYVQPVIEGIKKMAVEESTEVIFNEFIFGRMFSSLDNIKKSEEMIREDSVLLKMMPMTVLDKYGNPAAHYGTDDEYGSLFWQSYDYYFQISSNYLSLLFWQSYLAKKITYETTRSLLESSWFNEPISRNYSGSNISIKPIDILLPSIKRMFQEFDAYHNNENHEINLLVVIDSLTLKIESSIRYLFDKIGKKTFRQNYKKSTMQEKNLDELLSELRPESESDTSQSFSEEDRLFIRYIMTEKVGLNLRNRIAHGLIDGHEYYIHSADWSILVFSIIIRLCKYQFNQTDGTND